MFSPRFLSVYSRCRPEAEQGGGAWYRRIRRGDNSSKVRPVTRFLCAFVRGTRIEIGRVSEKSKTREISRGTGTITPRTTATGCLLIEIVGLHKIGEDYAETGSDCVAIFGGTQTRKRLLRGPMAWRVRQTLCPFRRTSIHPADSCFHLATRSRFSAKFSRVGDGDRRRHASTLSAAASRSGIGLSTRLAKAAGSILRTRGLSR